MVLHSEALCISRLIHRRIVSGEIDIHLLGTTRVPTLSTGEVTAVLVGPIDGILTTGAVGVGDRSGSVRPERVVVAVVSTCLRRGDRLALGEIARHVTRQGRDAHNGKEAEGQRSERHHLVHKRS